MAPRLLAFFTALPLLIFAPPALSQPAPTDSPYHLQRTLKIGGPGGWDYLTVDPDHHFLYVPRSTHTMVLDATSGKVIADIPGQQRNHGVALVPDLHRGFVTDGNAADVTVFDTTTYKVLGTIKADKDADGAIYDPFSKNVLVVCGDASSLYTFPADIDPATAQAPSPIDLGGKPEFLASDHRGKIFVNLQNKNEVAVVDVTQRKVLDRWPVAPGGSPVGMSIDREHHHLFVGCRNPQKLVVMSTDDGKVLADLPIGAGVDATQFDDGYALASCRDGTLAVAHADADGKFQIVQTVHTPQGARTMGLDPSTHTLYLPTAEMNPPSTPNGRPSPKPDTFMIAVVQRASP